jgi:hypothetical protein
MVRNHSRLARRKAELRFVESRRIDQLAHRPADGRAQALSHQSVERSMINECWSCAVASQGCRSLFGSNGRRVRFGQSDRFFARLAWPRETRSVIFFGRTPTKLPVQLDSQWHYNR